MYSHPWKVLRNALGKACSVFENLRLGGVNFAPKSFFSLYALREMILISFSNTYTLTLFLKFMLPKRRFGNVEKYVGESFCKHFSYSQVLYLGWNWWKVLTKCITHIFFDVPKSSFGEHKVVGAKFMVPKRRFWNVEKYVGNVFCKRFSSLLAQIEYLSAWKVLTKCLTHVFFDVPKSSFGDHKFREI